MMVPVAPGVSRCRQCRLLLGCWSVPRWPVRLVGGVGIWVTDSELAVVFFPSPLPPSNSTMIVMGPEGVSINRNTPMVNNKQKQEGEDVAMEETGVEGATTQNWEDDTRRARRTWRRARGRSTSCRRASARRCRRCWTR